MTIGMRIAEIRKERNLSQEAFCESLGVSRQAISKWEADQSVPDVEKLIAMSRRYGVSIGWILGTEEERAPASGELTEEQLRMVQEIVRRYIEAIPKPAVEKPDGKEKRGHLPRAVAAVVAAAIVIWCVRISSELGQVRQQQNYLQQEISSVRSSVATQIDGIAGRVEQALKAQNSLLADYEVKITERNLRAGAVHFQMAATPKTYIPGMTVEWVVDSETGSVSVPGEEGENHRFSANLSCQLADGLSVSIVLRTGDTEQTQLLEMYPSMFSETLMEGEYETFPSSLWGASPEELAQKSEYDESGFESVVLFPSDTKWDTVAESARFYLFVNGKEEIKMDYAPGFGKNWNREPTGRYGFNAKIPMDFAKHLKEGDELVCMVEVTDNYGRTYGTEYTALKVVDGRLEFMDFFAAEDYFTDAT